MSSKLGYEVDVIGDLVPGDLTAYVLDDLVRRRLGPGPSTTKALGRSPIFRYLKIPQVAILIEADIGGCFCNTSTVPRRSSRAL
jgi:hypothetical protein